MRSNTGIHVVITCLLLAPLTAQPEGEASSPAGPVDVADLGVFLDGILAAQLKAYDFSGAVVSVVQGGEVIFARGYGYADREEGIRVDPATTMFRIGSVSKLLTWTAVMQLAEKGRLDLETDVNRYLTAFKIPDTFPEPVTMKDLLTHTPGFEDRALRLFARNEESLKDLEEVLEVDLPARVRAPGTLASYSNHGTALAGYLVEVIAGIPWADYIEQNVMIPLEMNGSTVRQPIPEDLQANMSKGYVFEQGRFVAKDFEFIPAAPAGSTSATAIDMAHFMIAHLQGGRFKERQILEPATVQTMHSQLHSHDPRVSGMAHGFILENRNGQKIVGHGGDTIYFHSMLALVPEHGVGIFASYNSADGARPRSELVSAFLDRYFPAGREQPVEKLEGFQDRVNVIKGGYRPTRRPVTTIDALMGFGSEIRVSSPEEGEILISGVGPTARYVEVEPWVFREKYGQDRVVFKEVGDGTAQLLLGNVPILVGERVRWWQSARFHQILFGVCVLVLLSVTLGWPLSRLVHWWNDWTPSQIRPGPIGATFVAWSASTLFLLFLGILVVALSDSLELVYGIPVFVKVALVLPLIAAFFTLILAILLVSVWKRRAWGILARLQYTAAVAACLSMTWAFYYWNLLGWKFY